jgi:predicted CoA-substrate-specific enzyme activase
MKYACKYTPIELLAGFGMKVELLNPTAKNYELSDQYIHSNVCSYSRSIIEERLRDCCDPIILTSCCDSIERAGDVLKTLGQEVYILNLPHHNDNCCSKLLYQKELMKLIDELSKALNRKFDVEKFYDSFDSGGEEISGPYASVMGARINSDLLELIKSESPLPVKNNTCTGIRSVEKPPQTDDIEELMALYSDELLSQIPCIRMSDISKRRDLIEDPNLRGIIYNTVNFCDFYTFEYSKLKSTLNVPVLKIETDYTMLATEQIKTRLGAFYENMITKPKRNRVDLNEHSRRHATSQTYYAGMDTRVALNNHSPMTASHTYYAGIDTGSTSTNAVIIDDKKNIISFAIIPTGVKVAESAKKALDEALRKAGIEIGDISKTVATGYGRARIDFRAEDVTEITCHAKGAYFLNPKVRTIIDIGGQDSKVIKLDKKGNVTDFVMNDKCAAGTGRFIEMMAQSLQLSLEEMSRYGLKRDEDIAISSMCSVFAQSEVVSLIASDKKLEDIVHGINNSIASKVVALGRRGNLEREFMMTGGVARNIGVVRAFEDKLDAEIIVPEEPDICGALGAALIASEIY